MFVIYAPYFFFDPHTSEMCVSHCMPYASQLWFDGHLLCILWVFEQLVKTKISIFICITYHVADFRFILFISGLVGFIFSNGIVSNGSVCRMDKFIMDFDKFSFFFLFKPSSSYSYWSLFLCVHFTFNSIRRSKKKCLQTLGRILCCFKL